MLFVIFLGLEYDQVPVVLHFTRTLVQRIPIVLQPQSVAARWVSSNVLHTNLVVATEQQQAQMTATRS